MPYFIFWVIFIWSIFSILFLKITRMYKVIYYPEETEWISINFLFILPKRIAFNIIYYTNKNIFSFEAFKKIISILLIIFVFGIPIIMLVVIYMFIKYRDIWLVWYEISPYENIKLVIIDGIIIRNMKKYLEKIDPMSIINTSLKAKEGSIRCLTPLEKGDNYMTQHASIIANDSNVGALFTSKEQRGKDSNFLIFNKDGTYGYAQGFGSNKDSIEEAKIKNKDLPILFDKYGEYAVIKANKIIKDTNEKMIKVNFENKQKWLSLNDITKGKCKNFIDYCGGEIKTQELVMYYEYTNITIEKAKLILYKLANSNKEEIPKIYMKNKEIHDILLTINKKNMINKDMHNEVLRLLKAFDEFSQYVP